MKISLSIAYTSVSNYASALNKNLKNCGVDFNRQNLTLGMITIALVGVVIALATRFFQNSTPQSLPSRSPQLPSGQPFFAKTMRSIMGDTYSSNSNSPAKLVFSDLKCAEFFHDALPRLTFKLSNLDLILTKDHSEMASRVYGEDNSDTTHFVTIAPDFDLEVIPMYTPGKAASNTNVIKIVSDQNANFTFFKKLFESMINRINIYKDRAEGVVFTRSDCSYALVIRLDQNAIHKFIFFNPHGNPRHSNPNAYVINWDNLDHATTFFSNFFSYFGPINYVHFNNLLSVVAVKMKPTSSKGS